MDKIGNCDYISKIMALATEGSLLRRLVDHAYATTIYTNAPISMLGWKNGKLMDECRDAGVHLEYDDNGHIAGDLRVEGLQPKEMVRVVFT